MSNIISWWTVDNGVDEIMVNDSLKHTLRKAKKNQRRTRALNVELKKFAGLKCYSQYVTVKTEILRNISDKEDTDDEPYARSAIASCNTYHIDNVTAQRNRPDATNDILECDYEEEVEEQQPEIDERLQKKIQPTITCTESVKSKYTIIRDKDEKDRPIVEHCEISDCPPDECSLDDKETIELDRLSPDAKRVGRLKRMNLLYGNCESDTSQDTDNETLLATDYLLPGENRCIQQLSYSQIISDPLDSDEWYASRDKACKKSKVDRRKAYNYCPSASSSLHISDIDGVDDCTRKNGSHVWDEKSLKKSMRRQIAEQEIVHSNNETTTMRNDDARSVVNTITDNGLPSEAESLRYVLRNLCSTGKKDSSNDVSRSRIEYSTLTKNMPITPTELLSRPTELQEFIDRQRLVPTRALSTINIIDIERASGEQAGDEEIWLMEIPRSTVTDPRLCGKNIVLKREKMKIDDVCYKTIGRHDETLSCILSDGKERARYKTVNIRPVGSLVVRQKSFVTACSASSTSTITALSQSSAVRRRRAVAGGDADLVPFPNNLKSRNPLVASNALNRRS